MLFRSFFFHLPSSAVAEKVSLFSHPEYETHPFQLRILRIYVLARKVKSGDLSQVEVSYAVEGRGGPAPVKISRERMPLSDFLNTFGLTIEDVKKQLK